MSTNRKVYNHKVRRKDGSEGTVTAVPIMTLSALKKMNVGDLSNAAFVQKLADDAVRKVKG